jgi:hypothetical protein
MRLILLFELGFLLDLARRKVCIPLLSLKHAVFALKKRGVLLLVIGCIVEELIYSLSGRHFKYNNRIYNK